MKTMWMRLKNPDALLIALLALLLLMLPVAVWRDGDESWYWLAGRWLVLLGLSLCAGSWCARKYGVRKVNAWFLRAWMRKSLLVVFGMLIAANLVIRSVPQSSHDNGTGNPSDPQDDLAPVVPNCVEGLEADLSWYEGLNQKGQLVEVLRALPSELLAVRKQELGCDGGLTEAQQSRTAVLDQAFAAAVDVLTDKERAERAAPRPQQDMEAKHPQTFEVADYTELDFEPLPARPLSLEDFHDLLDDSRGVPVPQFDRRKVYKEHHLRGLFPQLLFGALGVVMPIGFTRTTIVEEVVEGVATHQFDVEEAVSRLAPLFEGLSVADQLRLRDLIAAELEVAVIRGEMSEEDANAIFARGTEITIESEASEVAVKVGRSAEAICAGLRDGKVPNETTKSMLATNPQIVQQVASCIRKVVPAGEPQTALLDAFADWGI